MEKSFQIADLIVKDIKGLITEDELVVLQTWIKENPKNNALYKNAKDSKVQLSKLEVYQLFNKNRVWDSIDQELFKTKTITFNRGKLLQYAAAIILPIILIGGTWIYLKNSIEPVSIAQIDTIVKPGVQKATLVLSNGNAVELDNEAEAKTINEGSTEITNTNNLLSYANEVAEITEKEPKQIIYNELHTPRGGGYNLKLADGSEVWMNAGSTLKFPVAFIDSTREVFLEGEAYFNVAHNGKPFIVNSGEIDVRVLGTSFNVSAYADDQNITTTLVEGKVQLELTQENTNEKIKQILTPNQQAKYSINEANISVAEVNTSQYTSWMKGKLEFKNESLDIVMKRLARWYDFEYRFDNANAKNYHFSGRVDNTEKLSTIFEMLEMTTDVNFEFKNNTIVVQ